MYALKTNNRRVLCLWLLFMGFASFNPAFSQSLLLTQAEYFYDTDPGYGFGVNIPLASSSEIDVSFELDISGLTNGFHKAYFRTKDENNVWSLSNVTDIYMEEIQQNPIPLPAIVYAEYYLDTDPGEGNGFSIPINGGTEIDTDFEISLDGVSPGFHKAYFRTKDENNVWSLSNVTDIYVEEIQQTPQPLPTIVDAEYYLDTDPGEGNGINIPVAGSTEIDIDFEISLDGVSPGFHKAYFRTKDENDVWSLSNVTDIYVEEIQQTPQSIPKIVHAEYFLDDDPGIGNGISIPLIGGTEIDTDFEINLSGVSAGFHKAYLRTKDENNVWSHTHLMEIYVIVNYQTLHVNIPAGWSGISSNVIPNDASVENIFEPVVDDMVILQNFDGMYWPFAGVNTIGNWNDMSGYQIKMETEQQVTFTGTFQDNLVANLTEGWNYLPVHNRCNNTTMNLFNQILNSLLIVKEIAGPNVYWPQFGINTLEQIKPGKAYFVLVDEDVEVEFPECALTLTGASTLSGQESRKNLTESPDLSEFKVNKTPISHTIAIPSIAISGLAPGNIIGVFCESGGCCGAVTFQNQNLALTVYGDDPTTSSIDGFTESEPFLFRVLNTDTDKECPLNVEFDEQMPQGGYFVHHGLSAIKSLEINGTGEIVEKPKLISVYPNPSVGVFNVRISDLTGFQNLLGLTSSWEVTNIHGSIVATSNVKSNDFTINLSSHPKGIYYLKITHDETQTVKKLVLQ